MSPADKQVIWLSGTITTPPFSKAARREAGFLIRRLQKGENLGMPHSRAMPSIGPHCHELRVTDEGGQWRIVYRTDPDLVVIVEIFLKKTQKTPDAVIAVCKARLRRFDDQ